VKGDAQFAQPPPELAAVVALVAVEALVVVVAVPVEVEAPVVDEGPDAVPALDPPAPVAT
jgi:hypothetical protein